MSIKSAIRFVCVCITCMLVLVPYASKADAATHYVPDNFATIQAAIDGSADGDTVLVRAGTYVENINFNGKAITLKSLDGAESTIIDGGGSGTVITFKNHEGRDTVVDGFTVTNGSASNGGGMYMINQVQPTILNCIITGNNAYVGGGIYMYRGTYPYIEHTEISGNNAVGGGGIYTSLASAYVNNSSIVGNTAESTGGGMLATYYSVNFLKNTFVSNNVSDKLGGGFMGYYRTETWAENVVFSGNSADTGGGIYLTQLAHMRILNNTITNNTADTGGGMYFAPNTWSVVVSSTIDYFNSSPSEFNGVQPSYSDIQGGTSGNSNIDTDPLFVDFENGDYHLSPGSPCIDTGGGSLSSDIEGNPRPFGAGYDIGAYEFVECADVPYVEITSVSPEAIWPPNNKETDVIVSGYVSISGGCNLTDATYAIDDEYGVYSGSGDLVVGEDGSFELVMSVEASRLGSDKDGRSYNVTISAADEAGDASATASAVVLHDMR